MTLILFLRAPLIQAPLNYPPMPITPGGDSAFGWHEGDLLSSWLLIVDKCHCHQSAFLELLRLSDWIRTKCRILGKEWGRLERWLDMDSSIRGWQCTFLSPWSPTKQLPGPTVLG
jgi:hypothetical protein